MASMVNVSRETWHNFAERLDCTEYIGPYALDGSYSSVIALWYIPKEQAGEQGNAQTMAWKNILKWLTTNGKTKTQKASHANGLAFRWMHLPVL